MDEKAQERAAVTKAMEEWPARHHALVVGKHSIYALATERVMGPLQPVSVSDFTAVQRAIRCAQAERKVCCALATVAARKDQPAVDGASVTSVTTG